MKLPGVVVLRVSMRWDRTLQVPIGRIAWRRHRAYFEYDPAALATAAGIANADLVLDEVRSAVAGWRGFAAQAGVGRVSTERIAERLVAIEGVWGRG